MMNGRCSRSARSPARAIFSPTTEPIDPPMKEKSITPRHTGIPSSSPSPVITASP
jgi:hypothetical protein